MPPLRVVIGIDWSDFAEKAFDWYIYNLHKKDNLVILAHFIDASSEKKKNVQEVNMRELQEVYETRMLQLKINYQWLHGSAETPGHFIVQTARENGASMIVMGARGLGKIKKAILGSCSDFVINKAKIPVLIYRWDG